MENSSTTTLLEIIRHIMAKHPSVQSILKDWLMPGLSEWENGNFVLPAPKRIKDSVLQRHSLPNSTWVESGTFKGETTELLLGFASYVISIEPSHNLYSAAYKKFQANPRVRLINDLSENALPLLLKEINGNISFWLDGHYSAGETFAGPNDTPLLVELEAIESNINRFDQIVILIDDIRFCGRRHAYGDYPTLDYLVDFSRRNGLKWSIEYDIFIAKSTP